MDAMQAIPAGLRCRDVMEMHQGGPQQVLRVADRSLGQEMRTAHRFDEFVHGQGACRARSISTRSTHLPDARAMAGWRSFSSVIGFGWRIVDLTLEFRHNTPHDQHPFPCPPASVNAGCQAVVLLS